MNKVLLTDQVIVFIFIEAVILFMLAIAFVFSLNIIKKWDFNQTSALQYKLEKRSYLIVLIIFFSIVVKLFMLPYFAYSIDALNTIIPGAMCAAGVIGANDYGQPLLVFKLILLFIMGIWLIINKYDIQAKNYPFFKTKIALFIILFILLVLEFAIDILYFTNISTAQPVLCCSVIYGVNSTGNGLPFNLDNQKLLILFYLVYALLVTVSIQKQSLLAFVTNSIFLAVGYYAVVYFFGTYVYELPTHQCPFCMLQKEYHYIGYFIWLSLFLGVFFGVSDFILKQILDIKHSRNLYYSILFNTLFVIICSFYVIRYYLVNGVFL